MAPGESSVPFRVERDRLAAKQWLPFLKQTEYSPHMNFRRDGLRQVRDHIEAFERWHYNVSALDVGGRNGEGHRLFGRDTKYTVLERDPPKSPTPWPVLTCDLYVCDVPACIADIIIVSNVLEHLLDPKAAFATLGRLLRPGGLLLLWSPWAWRYHAQPTYGDYWLFSARGLEYLCSSAGLSPVLSFYEHNPPTSGKTSTGSKDPNYRLDVPPTPWTDLYETYVICYRPSRGERQVPFEEVGTKPVQDHPRFDLEYSKNPSRGADRGHHVRHFGGRPVHG